jgi:hypothetical protein
VHIEDKKNLALIGKLGATHKQHMLCKKEKKRKSNCFEPFSEIGYHGWCFIENQTKCTCFFSS